jgi:hypothetical protein
MIVADVLPRFDHGVRMMDRARSGTPSTDTAER